MNNLIPLGHRVLIDPEFTSEEIKDGALKGFKLDVGDTFERERYATQIGRVVGVGPDAWKAFGRDFDGKPWASVGDLVYFAKYAHKIVKDGDKEYFILNDEDIQCKIREEKEESYFVEDEEENV